MNKSQVIANMGEPYRTSAQSPHEYFMYNLSVEMNTEQRRLCAMGAALIIGAGSCFVSEEFFVRFEDGVVESYGRLGDFDSTNVPEATINVNWN